MPLDVDQLSSQLDSLMEEATASDRQMWLCRARERLREIDQDVLREKLALHLRRRREPWLTAEPDGDLHGRYRAPTVPGDYTVASADGSSIAPDRHSPVQFYVLNAGWVRLTYGTMADFDAGVTTELGYTLQHLYFDPTERLYPVDGSRLSARMVGTELQALQQACEQYDGRTPVVALLDGTMILWMIQSEATVRDAILPSYLNTLDWFREQNVPVASYISSPGSFDLANMLRVYLCEEPGGTCRRCQTEEELQLCFEVRQFRDPALLVEDLEPGERTCLFRSQSEILTYYGEHEVRYFYMNAGDDVLREIIRVEVPQWVAKDETLLDQVHAVLWDQCCRSGEQPPYPPALHEAHEQAVISTGDREVVAALLQERLAQYDVDLTYSFKAWHKRIRGV